MTVVKDAKTVALEIHPAILHAANVIDRVWREIVGHAPRVTGLQEEGHSTNSRHYGIPGDVRCRAIDYDADSEHLPDDKFDAVDAELKRRLGHPWEYQIVWERMGTAYAHMHCEFDPKPVT